MCARTWVKYVHKLSVDYVSVMYVCMYVFTSRVDLQGVSERLAHAPEGGPGCCHLLICRWNPPMGGFDCLKLGSDWSVLGCITNENFWSVRLFLWPFFFCESFESSSILKLCENALDCNIVFRRTRYDLWCNEAKWKIYEHTSIYKKK